MPATPPWSPGEKGLQCDTLIIRFITGHRGAHAGFTNLTTPQPAHPCKQTWENLLIVSAGGLFSQILGIVMLTRAAGCSSATLDCWARGCPPRPETLPRPGPLECPGPLAGLTPPSRPLLLHLCEHMFLSSCCYSHACAHTCSRGPPVKPSLQEKDCGCDGRFQHRPTAGGRRGRRSPPFQASVSPAITEALRGTRNHRDLSRGWPGALQTSLQPAPPP